MLSAQNLMKEIALGNRGEKKYISVVPLPNSESIKGASIDLHLGRWFCLLQQSRLAHYSFKPKHGSNPQAFNNKEYFVDFNEEFVLHPGRFMLAITLEWIRLPADRGAYVMGKSNIGRRGLVIETAPGVHPFFNGCLTLEITNLGEIPLIVYPGMTVCQLFVHRADECEEPMESQFACQIKPTFGKNS